jgi:hypothetical protein
VGRDLSFVEEAWGELSVSHLASDLQNCQVRRVRHIEWMKGDCMLLEKQSLGRTRLDQWMVFAKNIVTNLTEYKNVGSRS